MSDGLALLLVLAVAASPYWLPKIGLHVWRKCACGARYCTTCGRRGN